MKARLVPVYFRSGLNPAYTRQLERLRGLLAAEAEIAEPVALGSRLPAADGVVLPRLHGAAFRQAGALRRLRLPLLALTSEFGTASMWDWEAVSFLKAEGVNVLAPCSPDLARLICRSLLARRELKQAKFLIFQGNPRATGPARALGRVLHRLRSSLAGGAADGEGRADTFRRYYWRTGRCAELMRRRYGVTVVKRSYRELAGEAGRISDREADAAGREWRLAADGVSDRALRGAIKLAIAVKREVEGEEGVRGAGINCLGEARACDTTPCLAGSMLFEERGLLWACEADTVSLLTGFIVHRALAAPVMMSNVYPFLAGQEALAHERIDRFPDAVDPEDHLLAAHCGYLGMVPRPFAGQWTLRPGVLGMVGGDAAVIDARLPTGAVTLAKIDPTLRRLQAVEGALEGYVQYPGSDCRSGALIRVKDGRRLMDSICSHHYLLVPGRRGFELALAAQVLGLAFDGIG